MPNKSPTASNTQPDPVQRLFAGMVKHLGSHQLPGFLEPFVDRCDLDVLRIVLDSGLVGSNKDDIALLACILPIVEKAPQSDAARAQAFVTEWCSAFEPLDHDKLSIHLSTAAEGMARTLLSLGANPNGYGSTNRNITALGRTHSTRHFKSALFMLEALAAKDEVPMHAYNVAPDAPVVTGNARFTESAKSPPQDISYFYGLLARVGAGQSTGANLRLKELRQHVQNIFAAINVPLSWKKDMARSLLRITEAKGLWKNGERAEIFGQIMCQAEFGSAVQFRHVVAFFAEDLRRENCVDIVGALAKKLADMGMHPDDIHLPAIAGVRTTDALTWLQAATFHQQVDMVKQLLGHGGDPEIPSDRGAGPSAYEMARVYGGEMLAVLDAWRAKSAIESVRQNARKSAPPT